MSISTVKSFSVGNGDMFYIDHASSNFTVIDCCLPDDDLQKTIILQEIERLYASKEIGRFISTHPDQDHIQGLEELDNAIKIMNFYCVDNRVTKKAPTDDFLHYCRLRDSGKIFDINKGCERRWMNISTIERGSAGIDILWPDWDNLDFTDALYAAEKDGSQCNNISPIIKYSLDETITFLWMGDLETDFMEKILDDVVLPEKVNVLFAPHHGRKSGKVPSEWLAKMNPDLIVIGEAPSNHLYYNYSKNYDTITQNSEGNITFTCDSEQKEIYIETVNSGDYGTIDVS